MFNSFMAGVSLLSSLRGDVFARDYALLNAFGSLIINDYFWTSQQMVKSC